MATTPRITPNIWCRGNAGEAVEFCLTAFAGECGWGKDPFGVSWQIVQKQMDQLLQHPGAYENMLGRKNS